MVKAYPKLGVKLVGEPGDVRGLADSQETFKRRMEAVPDKGMQVDQCFSDGNTRYRALAAVLEMNNRITASVASMGDISSQLHGWADYIDETRGKLDDLQRDVIEKERELARKEAEHAAIPRDNRDLRARVADEIALGKAAIGAVKKRAHDLVETYRTEAATVGEAIARASLDSPGADPQKRAARDNLKLADLIGTVATPLGLVGGLLGAAGKKLGSEALKRVAKALAGVGIGSSAAQLSAKGAADLAGAHVSPLDYVVTAAGLSKGITSEVLGNKYVDGAHKAITTVGGQAAKDEPPTVGPR